MVQQIKQLLKTEPFAPFTVITSSGEAYEIRHPEHAMLSKHFLHIVDADDDAIVHNVYLLQINNLKTLTWRESASE